MFRWYVINTYSGHENKVKTNLEHRIVSITCSVGTTTRRKRGAWFIETIRCSRFAFTLFSCPE